MRVITAVFDPGDRDYAKMVENMAVSVMNQGYKVSIYPLDHDPMDRFDNKHLYFTSCLFKPYMILKALHEFPGEDILWLDADCLMADRVDEMLSDCDIAVTLRRFNPGLRSMYDGYLNAGVMAFRKGEVAREFIHRWIARTKNVDDDHNSDQMAINKLLFEHTDMNRYGEVVEISGARVKLLDCDTYNFFYYEDGLESMKKAKIFHVKGHLREQHYPTVLEYVSGRTL